MSFKSLSRCLILALSVFGFTLFPSQSPERPWHDSSFNQQMWDSVVYVAGHFVAVQLEKPVFLGQSVLLLIAVVSFFSLASMLVLPAAKAFARAYRHSSDPPGSSDRTFLSFVSFGNFLNPVVT